MYLELGSIILLYFYFRFKNASVIKECDSQIKLCSNDNINLKQNIFDTQNALNNQNNIPQQKVKMCTNTTNVYL